MKQIGHDVETIYGCLMMPTLPLPWKNFAIACTSATLLLNSGLGFGTEAHATAIAQGRNRLPSVISTRDGDTLRVNDQGQTVTIRMACIDAPETAQAPWGPRAAQRLATLLPRNQAVQVRAIERDQYGRTVAELYLGNQSVNLMLVREGMAVIYPQHLHNCAGTRNQYLQAEQEARAARRGFWSQRNPVMPWEFRRQNRARS